MTNPGMTILVRLLLAAVASLATASVVMRCTNTIEVSTSQKGKPK